jgi:hypothetical protein
MDDRERHVLDYDADGEPRLYIFKPQQVETLNKVQWGDGDVCVCGEPCAKHWNAYGDWMGCAGAKGAK